MSGFTLIEVMVATLLGAFVVLGAEVAWWNTTKTVQQVSSQLDLQRDASFVLDSMSDAARRAATATIANYGSKTNNLMILKNGAGTEFARWYWNPTDNKIYASKNAGTASIFAASTVQNLTFSVASKQVTMTLTLADTQSQTAPFSTLALLRN